MDSLTYTVALFITPRNDDTHIVVAPSINDTPSFFPTKTAYPPIYFYHFPINFYFSPSFEGVWTPLIRMKVL